MSTIDETKNAAPGAIAIINRMSASLNEVHSHAFENLTAIETRIVKLKAAIVLQKNRSQQESQVYIELVDAALTLSRELDRAVDAIARVIEPPRANGHDAERRD